MKIKHYLLMLCLVVFSTGYMNAQVAIGSDSPPEDFSILQIDGHKAGGLRLSRLDTNQRDALAVSGEEAAKGLVIYNTDTKSIEFYDGNTWRKLGAGGSLGAGNGLSYAAGVISLGGTLTENTTINQLGNNLSSSTSGTAELSVNNDVFKVQAANNKFNADKFSILTPSGDSIFNVTKTGTKSRIDINAASGMAVNGNVLRIGNNSSSINGVLQFMDGTEDQDKVLTSDANGKATWKAMAPATTITPFSLSVSESYSTSNSNYIPGSTSTITWGAITYDLTLAKGKWIIIGECYTYTHNYATSGNNSNLIYLRLTRKTGTSTYTPIYTTADMPEIKAANNSLGGGAFATISIAHYLEVPDGGMTLRVEAYTPLTRTFLVSNVSWLNPGRKNVFNAIKIN